MKATGIVRKIDPLGRIVLPKELRDIMNISEADPIEIFTENNNIILRPYRPDYTDATDRLTRIIEDLKKEKDMDTNIVTGLQELRDQLLILTEEDEQ